MINKFVKFVKDLLLQIVLNVKMDISLIQILKNVNLVEAIVKNVLINNGVTYVKKEIINYKDLKLNKLVNPNVLLDTYQILYQFTC